MHAYLVKMKQKVCARLLTFQLRLGHINNTPDTHLMEQTIVHKAICRCQNCILPRTLMASSLSQVFLDAFVNDTRLFKYVNEGRLEFVLWESTPACIQVWQWKKLRLCGCITSTTGRGAMLQNIGKYISGYMMTCYPI